MENDLGLITVGIIRRLLGSYGDGEGTGVKSS